MNRNGQKQLSLSEFLGFFTEEREHVHKPQLSHLRIAQAVFDGEFIHPEGSRHLTTRRGIEFHMCDSGFYVYAVHRFSDTTTTIDLWYAVDANGLYLRDVERLVALYEGGVKKAM